MPHALQQLWSTVQGTATHLLDPRLPCVQLLCLATPPPLPGLQHALQELRALHEEHLSRARHVRSQSWANWVQESWLTNQRRLYRYTGGIRRIPLAMLSRPDGTCTAEPTEMDHLLRTAWMPIIRMYEHLMEPSWDAFFVRFRRYIRRVPVVLPALTATDLRATLTKQRLWSAPGPDMWRVAELRALPDTLLERLADVLNTVEATWHLATSTVAVPHHSHPKG